MLPNNAHPDLTGSMTALITPFRNGEVDWPALDRLIDRQIDAETDWLVPCGTTGESPTLTPPEFERIIQTTVERSAGRCRVLAGAGSNNTAETVRKTRLARDLGADAAMLVAPYYNRPTQEGLYGHYAAVAESVTIPIVLYNVPARTGVTISNDTIARLRNDFPNVAAVKDATGDLDGVTDLLTRSDITVLCGDDTLTWPMLAVGARGVISVISNLDPALVKALVSSALEGDAETALHLHRRLYHLAAGLGRFGPNPLPVKTALALRGLIAEEFRLPLCALDAAARAGIEDLLSRSEITEPVHA